METLTRTLQITLPIVWLMNCANIPAQEPGKLSNSSILKTRLGLVGLHANTVLYMKYTITKFLFLSFLPMVTAPANNNMSNQLIHNSLIITPPTTQDYGRRASIVRSET